MNIDNQVVNCSPLADQSRYIFAISEIYDDQRTFLEKVVDRSFSLLRELRYVYGSVQGRLADHFNPRFDFVEEEKLWKSESKGLYVLIHGLNGHPVIWQSHIELLEEDSNADLFLPYVPLRGNGPLEEVATPILNIIKDYIVKHPLKPVCLMGVSNGGRICTWLESRLRSHASSTPVRVSTIAAVHFGSSRMDLVELCRQWTSSSLGYHPSVVEDLCFGSEKAQEILDEVLQPLPEGTIREFEFFASTEDLQVPELSSSIPKLGGDLKSVNHIVHGYDHNGIVAGVSADQITSCREWMRQFE